MNKAIILISVILSFITIVHSDYDDYKNVYVPDEITWTERFILTELRDLRIDQESLRREIFIELQNREIWTIDRALSYSANTVNFFFVLLTILIAWFWVVWWKTIWDIKNTTKASMDRETKKIIWNFQKKIEELEKEQKINILWRQFNTSDSDKEKLNLLDKIYYLRPESQFVTLEKSNVYLSMWLYEKVIETTESIVSWDRAKHQPHSFYNRACAYNMLWDLENCFFSLNNLLNISKDYKDMILSSEYLSNILDKPDFKELLK